MNLVDQIGPVEALHEHQRPLHAQLVQHVSLHALCRRGRQRHHGHARKLIAQQPKILVVWPEVVAPLTDTVRFVNHKATQQIALPGQRLAM